MMYVNNSSINVGSTQVDLSDLSAAQSLVETYIVILKTRGTLEQVIEQENLSYDYETLSDMIEAGAVNSTEVFEIQVTSADPEEAERIANCIAELLPGRISEIVGGQLGEDCGLRHCAQPQIFPQHLPIHAAWAAAGRGGQLRYHRADGAL